MIYGELEGGLGNQMFQYAMCRLLQKHFRQDAVLDLSAGAAYGQYHARKKEFLLSGFAIDNKAITFEMDGKAFAKKAGFRWKAIKNYEKVLKIIPKLLNSKDLFHDAQKKSQPVLNRLGIYNMQYGPCDFSFSSKNKDIIFWGNFLSTAYVDQVKDEIVKEFEITKEIKENNIPILEKIRETQSVCVHIRRGDFTVKRYAMLNVCGEYYYQKAVKEILRRVPDAVFFVFSNDMEWAKNHIVFDNPVYFVDVNDSHEPIDDLRLMKECKHFIVANSSYSWWAQYLGKYDRKNVIGPKYFRKPGGHNEIVSTTYQMDNWLILDNSEDY